MDKLDRQPAFHIQESMPSELPEKIRLNFHRRYYRRKHYHLAILSFMMILGIWLVMPVVISLYERFAFTGAGFSLLDNLSSAILDMGNLLFMVWDGAVNFQSLLLDSLSISVLIGMICMGAAAIWGIAYFIPPRPVLSGD
jgi:hypothetical protein